jgi:hypothetical protein
MELDDCIGTLELGEVLAFSVALALRAKILYKIGSESQRYR